MGAFRGGMVLLDGEVMDIIGCVVGWWRKCTRKRVLTAFFSIRLKYLSIYDAVKTNLLSVSYFLLCMQPVQRCFVFIRSLT